MVEDLPPRMKLKTHDNVKLCEKFNDRELDQILKFEESTNKVKICVHKNIHTSETCYRILGSTHENPIYIDIILFYVEDSKTSGIFSQCDLAIYKEKLSGLYCLYDNIPCEELKDTNLTLINKFVDLNSAMEMAVAFLTFLGSKT